MSQNTVAEAISRSISHTEIVHLPYSPDACVELEAECEGSVESDEFEFWGTSDGSEWRVHVRKDSGVE